MNQPYLPVKIVLGIVAVSHIVTGLIGILPSMPLSYVLVLYGGALQFSPQIAYLLQIFGAYMLTIGVASIYAMWDPVKNRSIIHVLAFLLLFRGVQRILSSGEVHTVFGLIPGYYWLQTILFLGVALALLWFRPRAVQPA